MPNSVLTPDTQESLCWAVARVLRASALEVDRSKMRFGSEEYFIQLVQEAAPRIPLIVTATLFVDALEERLERLGCPVRLQKPFSLDTLLELIRAGLARAPEGLDGTELEGTLPRTPG